MSDKISVNPDSIRGLGDIVSPKTVSDFDVFNVKLTTASAVIDAETLPVFNHDYLPGSKLNDLDYLLCVPTEATTATVSFKLVHVTGATITGATVNITVNDTVVGSCTTDLTGVGSYSIDLTGAFLETSLFHVKISYDGNDNVSGCFKNIIFWHGDITGLTLTSDAQVVDETTTSHVLATLSGTNMLGESVGIQGQEVMVFEEYTPGLKIISTDTSNNETTNITAQIFDIVDGSRVSLQGQLINVYEEYTPGVKVKASKQLVTNGETITLTGQLIDITDGSHVALENQTIQLFEQYTPGVRIEGPTVVQSGDEINLVAELFDTVDGSRVALEDETIVIFEDYHPNLAVESNQEIIETGDSATLTATLLDDDGSGISGETVDIYEEYTEGIMINSTHSVIQSGNTATLTALLIDADDGSLIRIADELIEIYQEVDEIFYYVTLHHFEYSSNIELVTATVKNQFGDTMSDVLVEFHSGLTGSFTDVRTNSAGNAAISVRNPLYDNYYYVTLPEIYGDNVVADVDLRVADPASITLTSDKNILSYYSSESAVLTATVLDQNDSPLSGERVVFKRGSTVLDTVTTDSNGEAEYTYASTANGDVTFTVECDQLSDNITIEDCIIYDTTERTFTSTETLISSALYSNLFDVANTNWQLTYDIKTSGAAGGLNIGASTQYSPPSTANYRIFLGGDTSNASFNNRTTTSDNSTRSMSRGVYHTLRLIKNGTSFTAYVENSTIATKNITWLGNYNTYDLYWINWGSTNYMKNLKIKKI